jgi:hypothetical protein
MVQVALENPQSGAAWKTLLTACAYGIFGQLVKEEGRR